jgi:hypothetical protein
MTSAAAVAQEPVAGGPYRGLFAAAVAPPPAAGSFRPPELLNVSLLAFGALERDTARQGSPVANYMAVSAEVAAARTVRQYALELRGLTQLRRQQTPGSPNVDNQWLAAGIRALVTPRTTLTAAQRFAYSPLYTPGVLVTGDAPGGASAETGRGASANTNVTIASGLNVARQFSRRTTGEIGYGYDRVSFSNTGSTTSSHRTRAAVTRALRRDVALRLTQSSLWSTTTGAGAPPPTVAHELDAGIDYSPMRFRRTSLTFGIAPKFAWRKDPAAMPAGAAEPDGRTSIMLGGFTRIDHQFTRSWRAEFEYQRTTYYLPGYNRPILADAVRGGINGSLRRRLTTAVSAAYSNGTPDLRGSQSRVTGMTASARADFRWTRAASLYSEYRYDAYTISEDIPQLPGIARDAKRSSFRAGIAIGLSPLGPSGGRDADR